MNKFSALILVLAIAFVSGWLFGYHYPPPDVADLGVQTWFITLLVSVIGGLIIVVAR